MSDAGMGDIPRARARLDQAAAAAVDSVTAAARRLGHLDPAIATTRLAGLLLSRLDPDKLAVTLAALAVHAAGDTAPVGER